MTLAQNVRRLRTQRQLSQTILAKRAAVSQSAIAKLETGVMTNLTLDTLKRLAKALKVTVGELIK